MNPSRNQNPTPEGLLRFAIVAQTEGPQSSDIEQLGPLDPERRKWLEEVMQSTFGQNINPVQSVKNCLELLNSSETDDSQMVPIIDTLMELTETVDLSNDFHKVGGFPVLTKLLESPDAAVRAATCELFAQLMQNNPYCQEKALEDQFLPLMLNVMENDPDITSRIKALFGISSLLRSCSASQKSFSDLDGFSVLLRCMMDNKNDERFQIKAAFMLRSVCEENQDFSQQLAEMGIVQHLVALLQTDHRQYHELLMETLRIILEHSPLARKEATQPALNLFAFLKLRGGEVEHMEECREEFDEIQKILAILEEK